MTEPRGAPYRCLSSPAVMRKSQRSACACYAAVLIASLGFSVRAQPLAPGAASGATASGPMSGVTGGGVATGVAVAGGIAAVAGTVALGQQRSSTGTAASLSSSASQSSDLQSARSQISGLQSASSQVSNQPSAGIADAGGEFGHQETSHAPEASNGPLPPGPAVGSASLTEDGSFSGSFQLDGGNFYSGGTLSCNIGCVVIGLFTSTTTTVSTTSTSP